MFSKQKADANKYKNLFNDKDAKVRQLQEELDNTKSETSNKLSIIEDEVGKFRLLINICWI